jgi:uncharacterized repeat protein (TIGR01451 family)
MKRSISGLIKPLAACVTIAAWASGTSLRADEDNQKLFNEQYRENYEVPLGEGYTGRSPYFRTKEPAPRPVAQAKPIEITKPAPSGTCSEIRTGLIHMMKRMPAEVSLGETFMYELNPTAAGCAGNVVVSDHVPAGASYVRSEPAAEVQGDHLVWKFHEMEPGQSIPIKVWLRADKEGKLASCATVSADPRACGQTVVGKPVLAIDKSGPETAQLGSDVTYNIVVSNRGTSAAQNVVVTDAIPDGLSHNSGQRELTFNVGTLAPGQSRSLPVTLKAGKRGRVCNPAVANSSNAGKVSDEACTTITQPGLKIAKTGDAEHYINKRANYKITVTNTGDTALTGVVVTDTAPAPTAFVSASGATMSGNTATWNVGTLAPGASKTFDVVLTSRTAGRYCNAASVTSTQGLRDSAEACTVWKGLSALLLELVDDPDPIQVGETTTYTVRVTNQGNADETNIKMRLIFPAEVDPASASGGGTISGKTVTFPTYQRLAPKQSFTYTVTGRGAKEGVGRVKAIRDAESQPGETTEEETTRVY